MDEKQTLDELVEQITPENVPEGGNAGTDSRTDELEFELAVLRHDFEEFKNSIEERIAAYNLRASHRIE